MQLELELQAVRPHALFIGDSAEAGWQPAVCPWLERVAARSWQTQSPAAIIVPTRGQEQFIKARLLQARLSVAGLLFLTPAYLRALLAAKNQQRMTPPTYLQLLVAAAAEELTRDDRLRTAEYQAAVSVRRAPQHLLRLLEQLTLSGVSFSEAGAAVFGPVVERFETLLARAGLTLQAAVDRALTGSSGNAGLLFSEILITGFHGAHWPYWPLLTAAVCHAEQATVVLQLPRAEAADLDQVWIGSWEERLGEAEPISIDAAEASSADRETFFLAGFDTRGQAEAIVAAIRYFVARDDCSRLGVLFPKAGALPRLVALLLREAGLPHNDAMGELLPGPFEEADFQTWLELQQTPRLNALRRFLTALPTEHTIFEGISRDAVCQILERVRGAIAIDDLSLLVGAAQRQSSRGPAVAAALACLHFLPDEATFDEFIGATADAFAALHWEERRRQVAAHHDDLGDCKPRISKTLFLRWLEESLVTFRVTRGEEGEHPYARIHLLTPAQAEEQVWSHLIFADLNEGTWPAAPTGDLLPAGRIESLNRDLQKTNRQATKQGSQGEGHIAVRDGRTLLLGPGERQRLGRAQFEMLRGADTLRGTAFTISLVQEDAPERISNPGEFFNRLYHETKGCAASQPRMRALREATRRWLEAAKPKGQPSANDSPGVETRRAYDARRTIAPSNEFDFSLCAPLRTPRSLSVSEVEQLLQGPGLAWMSEYLGVEGEEDSAHAWVATIGKWSHAWLAEAVGGANEFVERSSIAEFDQRLTAAAKKTKTEVQRLCQQYKRLLPDWWLSGWDHAFCLARLLSAAIGHAQDWKWIAAEWSLEETALPVDSENSLIVRGRADLLLAQSAARPKSLEVPELWVIDLKTGNKKSLAPGRQAKTPEEQLGRVRKQVLKGEALQLWLYALAARVLGAERVQVSLVSSQLSVASPQLGDDAFDGCRDVLKELARTQSTGIYGMRGHLRNAYSLSGDYPLATLAIDPDILEERWELTHPALAMEDTW